MRRWAIALIAMLSAIAAQADTSDIARNAISGFIVPGYERFVGEAELQQSRFEILCTTPSADNLQKARVEFEALVTSWSRVEAIRFGPVLKENRLERILFWPDRRSIGLRQVQAALASNDPTVVDIETLSIKSVAMQGLGALEFVLYGTGADGLTSEKGAHRCAYGRTIAEALTIAGTEIVDDWLAADGIAARMIDPQPEWADYRTEKEVLRELLGIWVHGAELLRDTRILPFLAETTAASKFKSALFWRSDLTISAMQANVAGLRDLFIVAGIADALPEEGRWAGGSFLFEMENFERTAGEITLPIEQAVADTEARTKINYLLILTRSLQNLSVEQLATQLGLSVGFSALDGD